MEKKHKNKKIWSAAKRFLPSILTVVILPSAVFAINHTVYQNDNNIELKTDDIQNNGELTMNVKKNIEIEEGKYFDPSQFITAKQGDTQLGLYVSGANELQTAGVHIVKVSSTAADGSFIQKNVTVTVKEKQNTEKKEEPKTEEPEKEETEKKDTTSEQDKQVTKPVVVPPVKQESSGSQTEKPATTPPVVQKPADTKPKEPEVVTPPKDSVITYYPDDPSPAKPNTSGYYKTVEGCRADHTDGNCVAAVGADGVTIEGYVWVSK